MSERRCPSCGGLVGAEAEWCGQCFTRLDGRPAATPSRPETESTLAQPTPPAPQPTSSETGTDAAAAPPVAGPAAAAKVGSGPFRAGAGGLVWTCPTCSQDNPLEATTCTSCGTPFKSLFEEGGAVPTAKTGSSTARAFLYPGLGYAALGRASEGVARGVTFTWMLGMAIAIIFLRRGLGLGPFFPLVALLGAACVAVYILSAIDAGRIARGEKVLLGTRPLLFGSAGMMMLTIALFLIVAIRAGGTA